MRHSLPPPLPPAPPGSEGRRRSCSGLVARFLGIGDRLFQIGGALGAHRLGHAPPVFALGKGFTRLLERRQACRLAFGSDGASDHHIAATLAARDFFLIDSRRRLASPAARDRHSMRSEEQKSELQSLMRSSYAVFCLQKKKT